LSRSDRESLSLRIPALAPYLLPARALLETALSAWFGERGEGTEAQEFLLAVQEGLTNIIRHAYRNGAGPLVIELSRSGDGVEALLRDWGVAFDPDTIPPPDFDRPREGGYGLYIMRTVTEECAFERSGGENRLRMRKRILVPTPARAR
jgi:anti-sigma regulatory factor (Ser/Thr protein kinase)